MVPAHVHLAVEVNWLSSDPAKLTLDVCPPSYLWRLCVSHPDVTAAEAADFRQVAARLTKEGAPQRQRGGKQTWRSICTWMSSLGLVIGDELRRGCSCFDPLESSWLSYLASPFPLTRTNIDFGCRRGSSISSKTQLMSELLMFIVLEHFQATFRSWLPRLMVQFIISRVDYSSQ